MSILDWSDPEEMLGLLIEFLRDELLEETRDRARARFLRTLANDVESLDDRMATSPHEVRQELRRICDSQRAEFERDPALVHVRDCLAELERIAPEAIWFPEREA